ncbi:tetratricopeptide repeat protein [uncultured Brevibacillus sp.]|uniref:tetratricopeptide repeat protein n=1 Tax=uncultured Brevibacillus sp. TaxID=169970 RepID=UPI0025936663|nr:tetratricopeptide repeat protein [uncultured Brevibacillus sp.]
MKRFTLSLFVFVLIAALVGCSPKDDPKVVLNTYYTNVMNANYEDAYAILSEADRKASSKEDFVLFMNLNAELYKWNGIEIKNKEMDSDSLVFTVAEKLHNNSDDRDESVTYKRAVIKENDEWKIFVNKNYGEEIPALQNSIGWMYIDGYIGPKRNGNEAAKWFHEALKRDASYYQAYYGLSLAYAMLGKYDDAMTVANKYISLSKEEREQSGGYNVIGLCYMSRKDLVKAKEAFQKAVELDPTNEYAITNLSRFK